MSMPPQPIAEKKRLWEYIARVIDNQNEPCVLFGDFNVVRDASERMGTNFCSQSAADINDFLFQMGLVDVPLIRRRFMRISKDGTKMARLDRFLIYEELLDKFPNIMSCIMERKHSDRCHILLKQDVVDYGPTSFKLFHSWLEDTEFDSIVQNNWGMTGGSVGSNKFVHFKNNLKQVIRSWQKSKKHIRDGQKLALFARLEQIERVIQDGQAADVVMLERQEVLKKLMDIDRVEKVDIMRKTKL